MLFLHRTRDQRRPSVPTQPCCEMSKTNSVRILELALEFPVPLLAEIEEKRSAGRFDAFLRFCEIIYLETKMVGADSFCRIAGDIVSLVTRELEEREIDDAIAHIDRRSDVEVFTPDFLQIEYLE